MIITAIENYPQAFAAVGDDPSISTSRQIPPSSQQVKVVDSHGHQGEHWHWLTCLGLMVMLRFGLREILHHILSLTKIQCQRSINSSASIMIVQLPWKGVD